MKEFSARAGLVRRIVEAVRQVEGVDSPGQVVDGVFKSKAALEKLV